MLGDLDAAKYYLRESGSIHAGLGLPSGLLSLSLVSPKSALNWLKERDDFVTILTETIDDSEDVERKNERYPYIEKAVESGNNTSDFLMLDAVLAKSAKSEGLNLNFLSKFRERVKPRSRSSVGITEIDLRSFTSILDEISSRHFDKGDKLKKLSRSNERTMQLSLLRRESLFKDLREDTWHWKRIPEPAKLIDFDLLMFGCLSFETFSSTEMLHRSFSNLDPLVLLPFRAAEALRS